MSPVAAAAVDVNSPAYDIAVNAQSMPILQGFVARLVDDVITLETEVADLREHAANSNAVEFNLERSLAHTRGDLETMRKYIAQLETKLAAQRVDAVDALELLTCWAAFGISSADVSPAELQLIARLAARYR